MVVFPLKPHFIQDSPVNIARGSSDSRSFSEKHRAHFTRRPPLPQFFGVVSSLGRGSEATYHVTGDIPSFKGYYGEPPTSYAGFMMVIPLWQHFTTSLAFHSPCTTQFPNPAEKTAPTWWSSSFTFWQIVIILKLETCCHFGNCFELSGDDFVNHLELRQFLVICQIPTWTALPFSRSRYIYIYI